MNVGILLNGSEKARELRSLILNTAIEVVNKKAGGNTKYINQRDENYIIAAYYNEINGFDQAVVGVFMREMENPILLAARNELDKDDLRAIIHDVIYDLEVSDETKSRYLKLL